MYIYNNLKLVSSSSHDTFNCLHLVNCQMIDVVNSFEINSDCEVKRVLAIIIIVIVTILDMPNIVCDLCVPAGKQIHQQLPKLLRVISTVHPHPHPSLCHHATHSKCICSRCRMFKSPFCKSNKIGRVYNQLNVSIR